MIRTFRSRLAVWYIAIELSVIITAAVLMYILLSNDINQHIDNELLEQAQAIVKRLEETRFHQWSAVLAAIGQNTNNLIELVAVNGKLLYPNAHVLIGQGGGEITTALQGSMQQAKPTFASTSHLFNEENVRVLAAPVIRGNQVIASVIIGKELGIITHVFESIYFIGGILGLLSIIISAYAGYELARKALRPIREISGVAGKVADGDLSQRLQSFSQDMEISHLIKSLNTMFEQLDKSFKAQRRFTADASHELRIPLTVLKGDIEVTLRKERTPKEYQNMLRQKLEIIERMQRIVNGLLTLAKADAGTLELQQQPIDLSLLLEEVAQHHLGLFMSKNLSLELDTDDDLIVMGDQDRLEQVMFNLFNNAFKYSPDKGNITLFAHARNETVMIRVSDQGPGIDQEHLDHLFDRFYRADSDRNRGAGGAGLGLAICKRIVEAHEGKLSVESKVGKGTTFVVTLPLATGNPQHMKNLQQTLGFSDQDKIPSM